MTIMTDAERRRQDSLNTAGLVALLGLMAFTTIGGVITVLVQRLDRQLEIVISLSGLILAAGLVAVIVYVLVNPLHDQPSRTIAGPTVSLDQRSDDYSTLAIAAFVLCFVFSLPGIILGHLALRDIRRTGKRGRGLALAALIIGYSLIILGAAFWILVVVVFQSP